MNQVGEDNMILAKPLLFRMFLMYVTLSSIVAQITLGKPTPPGRPTPAGRPTPSGKALLSQPSGKTLLSQQSLSVSVCPRGFIRLNGTNSCYMLPPGIMSWNEASEMCKAMHPAAYLASITNAAENRAIVNYLQQTVFKDSGIYDCKQEGVDIKQSVWTGGHRANCGDKFVWQTATGIEIPFGFTYWDKLPDCIMDIDSDENCVHIAQQNHYRWNDMHCRSRMCALCEI